MCDPYVFHDPHTRGKDRSWGDVLEIIAVDPGKSMGFLRERRSPTEIVSLDHRLILADDKVVGGVSTFYSDVARELTRGDPNAIHVVVIEKQLPQNTKMQRLEAHIVATFQAHLRDRELLPLILVADARHKYRQLGVPKGTKARARKEWGTKEARRILEKRNDKKSLALLSRCKGKARTDVSDVVLEIEALCAYYGWPTNASVYG